VGVSQTDSWQDFRSREGEPTTFIHEGQFFHSSEDGFCALSLSLSLSLPNVSANCSTEVGYGRRSLRCRQANLLCWFVRRFPAAYRICMAKRFSLKSISTLTEETGAFSDHRKFRVAAAYGESCAEVDGLVPGKRRCCAGSPCVPASLHVCWSPSCPVLTAWCGEFSVVGRLGFM